MPSARFNPQMYSSSNSTMMNNGPDLDGSGTINPATLNPAGAFAAPHQAPINRIQQSFYSTPTTHDYNTDSKPRVIDASSRGIKRSRSPEAYREGQVANDDINQGSSTLLHVISHKQILIEFDTQQVQPKNPCVESAVDLQKPRLEEVLSHRVQI